MSRALSLAVRGRGWVEPNPMVGAVVVRDGRIVGEGFHERFGGDHAEVNALRAAGEAAQGAELFVTLEPCRHFGKTPPCTRAVITAGIRRVVAAMPDPFPEMSGKGIAELRSAGINVEVGVGEVSARRLNAAYLTRLRAGRPWFIAKWAMSLDGRTVTAGGESQWITGPDARSAGHELRGQVDAVVVGRGTLTADNPLLTARPPGPRRAVRVVIARGELPPPPAVRMLQTIADAPVMLVVPQGTGERIGPWKDAGAQILEMPLEAGGRIDLSAVAAEFGRRGMTNVLLEGGADLIGGFADADLIDEVRTYVAPTVLGGSDSGGPVKGMGRMKLADRLALTDLQVRPVGDDWELIGLNRRSLERIGALGNS